MRPEIYKEINNFYTTTVYEKGAEVVRMVQTLIGKEKFRAGMDLYFARHDGEAATVEQFIQCFADVSGRDFAQFMRWYSQAGTPQVTVTGRYRCRATRPTRSNASRCVPPTPGQPAKAADGDPARASAWSARMAAICRLRLRGGEAIERGVLVLSEPAHDVRIHRHRRAPGAVDQPRLLGADQARHRPRSPTTSPSSPRTTAIRSIAGRRCRRFRCGC